MNSVPVVGTVKKGKQRDYNILVPSSLDDVTTATNKFASQQMEVTGVAFKIIDTVSNFEDRFQNMYI